MQMIRQIVSRVRGLLRGQEIREVSGKSLQPVPETGRTHHCPEPIPLRPHLLALHVAAATPWMKLRRVARNDNARQVKTRPS